MMIGLQTLVTNRTPIRSGILGWWSLGDGSGSTARDSSGYGNNGALTNMEAEDWEQSSAGPHLVFDGLEWVALPAGAISRIAGKTNGTFCAWGKCTTGGLVRFAILTATNGLSGSTTGSGNLSSDFPDESCVFTVASGGTNTLLGAVRNGQGYYANNVWHHFAFVVDGISNKFYVDGIAQATGFAFGSATSNHFTNVSGANVFRIGGQFTNSIDYGSINARIRDVRYYSSILTASQIAGIAKQRA